MTEPATSPRAAGTESTRRSRLKADRREQLLRAAAQLVAERGFSGVRLEDIGAAVGISGPAIYRHFSSKEALLVELLSSVSRRLLTGARAVAGQASSAEDAIEDLVDFHLDFALGQPDLIRVQDRDLHSLPEEARREIRHMQRRYVELWVAALIENDPRIDTRDARIKAHGVFGLLNSTAHSLGGRELPDAAGRARAVLRSMALGALFH
ncbi:TetR family transcriptional regulator [Hoyosella sp. G463]|uniref:TetR family transcriptional regulator n=1 Tax=Lolliginicoccus lacisalsi TaxID=2742202 RepID=A0A927PMU1_9ACTN|nr:TetR/AcrR family transcriptional regulator [Lolliginicoccus lacisalsi]MBD8507097.1 TetR family transcriptional regulator [Lolliginicoccus lacisalsi]